MPDHSLFDDDSLVDDLSEDQFIGVIHQTIINKDEILRIIRGIVLLPVQKRLIKLVVVRLVDVHQKPCELLFGAAYDVRYSIRDCYNWSKSGQ